MISSTAQYALRSVVYLASVEQEYSTRSEIAQATQAPVEYLLKVLQNLEQKGLVESRRGPGGGYHLVRNADQLTVLEVVRAVDASLRITECPLGIRDHKKLCPLHALLDEASRRVEEAFEQTTISQLIPPRVGSATCSFPR